ncbi:phage distal tail protein [Streptomyces sp. NPDC002851]
MSDELKDFQMEFSGIRIGHGTSIPIAGIEGLARPGVRGEIVEQPNADGAWLSPDWYEARTLRIDCGVKTPGDPAAAARIVAQIEEAADDPRVRTVGGAVMPLRIKWPGAPVRVLFGRLRKAEASWEEAAFGWVPLDIEFTAPDTRFYADTEQAVQLRLGWLSGGGFTAPVQAPIRVSDGDVSGQNRPGWLFNGGNTDAYPVITVYGPCTNPVITHVETGRKIALGITVPAGEHVTIDTRPGQRTITRQGGGTVATTSPLGDFKLPPGRSEIRWIASDPTASARLTMAWRDAFKTLVTPKETTVR